MISFAITITENESTKLIDFVSETPASPDATEAEIKYAKAFQLAVAVFKDHLSTKEDKQSKFHKSYGRETKPPESSAN